MRAWPSAFVLVAMSLSSAPGCGENVDHCEAYSETCNKWCEGANLSDCRNEGAALAQAQDQEACFDASMRLACDSFDE
jgi:hypothetical protein